MKPCDAPCPKCGSTDIYRLFHKRDSIVENREHDIAPHPGFNVSPLTGWRSYARNDCIVQHCRTCQYEWVSKPPKATRPRTQGECAEWRAAADAVRAYRCREVTMSENPLATAIIKFAPDLALQLKDRWETANKESDQALKEFVAFLRGAEPDSATKAGAD